MTGPEPRSSGRPLVVASLLTGSAAFLSFVCGAEVLGWILTVVCVAVALGWLSSGAARR